MRRRVRTAREAAGAVAAAAEIALCTSAMLLLMLRVRGVLVMGAAGHRAWMKCDADERAGWPVSCFAASDHGALAAVLVLILVPAALCRF